MLVKIVIANQHSVELIVGNVARKCQSYLSKLFRSCHANFCWSTYEIDKIKDRKSDFLFPVLKIKKKGHTSE